MTLMGNFINLNVNSCSHKYKITCAYCGNEELSIGDKVYKVQEWGKGTKHFCSYNCKMKYLKEVK